MDEEMRTLIRLAAKFRWAQGEERATLERHGVNLVRSDFYSESPSLDDIDASFEYAGATGPADSPAVFDDPAIFDMARIVAYAQALVPFAAGFDPPREAAEGFAWKNGQFSYCDAMALYALICKERPRTVIEIGSGFSSHVAHRALADVGEGGRLVCIDPEPRTAIAGLEGVEFLQKPIQGVDPRFFNERLTAGDVVFYDGSHTLKTGSDTLYFYLKLLPYLRPGPFVHAHDVRLPYPRDVNDLRVAKLYWGEPYVLMSHLFNTARYDVLFASYLLYRRRVDVLEALMHGRFATGGASLWYRIRD